NPVSTSMKPACMNITRKPVTSVQTKLMEKRLWIIRPYSASGVSCDGSPSPTGLGAGSAQMPALAPVGSGQSGAFGSGLVPVIYGGSAAGSAAAEVGAAAVSSFAGSS